MLHPFDTIVMLTIGLGVVATEIFLINLPFGFWRAGVKRFSTSWFIAVHSPVPLAIGLRLVTGVGLRLNSLPVFVGAFFAGQFLGGVLRKVWPKR